MNALRSIKSILAASILTTALGHAALARPSDVAEVKRTTEHKVREIIEPILSRYCSEQCKILTVNTEVEVAIPEQVAPGFDEVAPAATYELGPSSVKVKVLVDQMVGPVSRGKILSLVQENLSVLPYPVFIETKMTEFPQPLSSARKITELRQKVESDFRETMTQLFNKFCPEQCLLADFKVEVDPVNAEEAQYGSAGEYIQDGDTAIRVRNVSANILLDDTLTPDEQTNILEMAKLKSSSYKNVDLKSLVMRFPIPDSENGTMIAGGASRARGRGIASVYENANKKESNTQNNASSTIDKNVSTSQSLQKATNESTQNNQTTTSDNSQRQERFERFEKIERVESGDAVQEELKKFQLYALIFGCAVLSLLIFTLMAVFRPRGRAKNGIQRIIQTLTPDSWFGSPSRSGSSGRSKSDGSPGGDRASVAAKRYEIERLMEELTAVFAEQPKVAKQVFSRVLKEEGVETTAAYISMFGEAIVLEMLRDPSLQTDLADLTEFYAKNPIELSDDERLELLKVLHNRTIAAKMIVMGNRSAKLFDFLVEMDALQILELVKNESITVKAIVMTQCDTQKRQAIFGHFDDAARMQLLTELSRIDYLPRDYIYNVANALKRKRKENPRLNTEALPGSDVLVNLLERVSLNSQRNVIKSLESYNPEAARSVKSKLVSLDTLPFMRDAQLLEVVLSLKHDELLQFLKGAPAHVRDTIYQKSPKDLVAELEEELTSVSSMSRDAYQNVERKILNRVKIMASDGILNLVEVNERMFSESAAASGMLSGATSPGVDMTSGGQSIRKVAGW